MKLRWWVGMEKLKGFDDFIKRKILEGVDEKIIDNIRIKRLELKEDLKNNGGIISLNKSGIFRMIRRGGDLVMIETTPGDNNKEEYERLKDIFNYLNESGYAYNKYKIMSEEVIRYGVIVRTDNKETDIIEEIDIEDTFAFRRIDTSDAVIESSEDAYKILRSQYETKSDIIFYEWKYFNHLAWYAFRPFWMKIFDETIIEDNL